MHGLHTTKNYKNVHLWKYWLFFLIQGTKQQKQQWNLLWLTLNEQSKIGVKLQSKMLYFKEAVYSAILATFLMHKPP